MTTRSFEILSDARCMVGESPVWHPQESALYWVDIEGRRIHRVDAEGRSQSWATPERIGCIAMHAGGGLLAAMETGLFHVQLPDAPEASVVCEHRVEFPWPNMRFNDGRCDRRGRFWVSSMVRDMSANKSAGALFVCDESGLRETTIKGLLTGNGLAFSPEGRVMYLSDSHPHSQQIWTFELDDTGQPQDRRLFVDMNAYPGRPDGAAVDADGCYWICANDAGLIHRFTPEGKLDRSLPVPAAKPAMCAFGGAQLDRLYVTTIQPATPIEGYDPALAGATFVLNPGCTGLADSPYLGR